MIRRRKALVVTLTIILVQLIIISLINHHTTLSVPNVRETLLKFKISISDNVITIGENGDDYGERLLDIDDLELEGLAESVQGTKAFNKELDQQFKAQYQDLKDDGSLFSVFKVNVNKQYEGFDTITLPLDQPKEMKYFQHYDPRFTFGLLLNHLTQQLKAEVPLSLPTFHWGDFVDLTPLTPSYYKLIKQTCSDFDFRSTSFTRNTQYDLFSPRSFCLNDEDIEDFDIKANRDDQNLNEAVHVGPPIDDLFKKNMQLIKENPYKTGFHIFSSAGSSSLDLKIILSRSYLNDFMPFPKKIQFLLPHYKTLSVPVDNQILLEGNNKKRLIDTDIFNNYVQENGRALNVTTELRQFMDQIKLKKTPTKEPRLSYLKHLTHENFKDKTEEYISELSNAGSLSPSDQLYLDSLKYSQAEGNPPKYFSEAKLLRKEPDWALGGHYDWKFFNGLINYTDKTQPALHGLIKAWLRFTNSNDFSAWIAHGSLLSWYWNAEGFPWDNDIDVQMPIEDLHRLSRDFNQSIIVDFGYDGVTGETRYGRYFMDCSTFITKRERGNGKNNIDARFIDLDTGLYIDITGMAVSDTHSPDRYNDLITLPEMARLEAASNKVRNDHMMVYNCKNNHFENLYEITPLKMSLYEGEYTHIPNNFQQLLVNEYDLKGITSLLFSGYLFVPKYRIWVQLSKLSKFLLDNIHLQVLGLPGGATNIDRDLLALGKFTEDDYVRLALEDDFVLNEYMVTRDISEFHEIEILKLLSSGDASGMLFNDTKGPIVRPILLRHDFFTYNAFKNRYNFNNYFDSAVNDFRQYERAVVTFQENKKIAELRIEEGDKVVTDATVSSDPEKSPNLPQISSILIDTSHQVLSAEKFEKPTEDEKLLVDVN